MPQPEDLASPRHAETAREKLINVVDQERNAAKGVLRSSDAHEALFNAIDKLTYEYFGLSDDEVTLIEDAVEHILPAAQPNAGSYPDLWKMCGPDERKAYVRRLQGGLLDWFTGNCGISLARIFHESPWFDGISYVQGFR